MPESHLPCSNRFAMFGSLCHVRITLPCSDRFAMFGSHCHVRMCGERNAMAPQHKGAPRRTERHSANKTGLHDNRNGVTPQTERCGTTNETAWGVKQNAAARRTKRHGAANKMGTDTRTPERCGYRSPFVLRVPAVATSIRVIHLRRPIPRRATARTANPGGGQPSGTPSADQAAAAPSVDFTCSTMALNAGLSLTASSASTLRSRPMLAFSRPFMKTL